VRPGRAADHSPPSTAAVMEEYSYTSTHPLGHTGAVTGPFYLSFNKNNNNIYLLQLGCNPVTVVMLHVYKT